MLILPVYNRGDNMASVGYMVTFYTFDKKINSTKRPNKTYQYVELYCRLNDGSGLINPVFKVDFSQYDNINAWDYNYCYVQEFDRYYFVKDWRYNLGLWICETSVDVLASYKGSIGAMSTYVLRSASNFDRYLPDNLYPVKSGATYATKQNNNNPFAASFSGGYFVAGIINNDSGGYGAVNYYVFTASEFRSFSNYLLSNVSIYGVTDISSQLLKCLYNPFQYVVSCMWLPIEPPKGANVSSVPIGWWTVPTSAARLSGFVRVSGTCTCEIPRNPEGRYKQFMYGEPYTEYYLDFPPFGSFSISADNLINATVLDFAWNVDCITGLGRLQMGANSAQPFNIVHAQIGVPIQLAQMSPPVFDQLQQAIPDTGIEWADTIINTLGNVGNALVATKMPMQTTGTTGGFMGGYYPIKLTGIFHGVAEENLVEFGAPFCQTIQLRNLRGYILCAHGEFDGTATREETEQINSFLTSGFFYE